MIPLSSGELDEIPGPHQDGSTLWCQAGHGDASSTSKLQQTFVAQKPQGSEHGVGVHTEHGRQVAGWGEPLARHGFTLRDGASNFPRDLLIEREPLLVEGQFDILNDAI